MRVIVFLKHVVFAIVLLLGAGGVCAAESELLIDLDLESVGVEEGADGKVHFACKDVQWLNPTGAPRIPWQVVTVLLPPDVRMDSLKVQLENARFETVSGKWSVLPAPPAVTWKEGKPLVVWPADKRIVNGQDLDIYKRNDFYPRSSVQLVSTGRMRKWRLAQVALPLVCYNPVRGTLQRLVEGKLSVGFNHVAIKMSDLISRAEMADHIGRDTVRRIAVNFSQVSGKYEMAAREAGPMANGVNPGYVIITTSAIQSASAQLSAFVTHKASQGFDVQVITETDFGGGTGNTAAENIRAWLQANYLSENIEYVLLIGNPDPNNGNVPMKLLYPRIRSPFYWTPSDYYYADLTGNWDLDGDNNYGEYEDDFGTGGVDRNWEVIVGRIPYYDVTSELDSILQRIIDYQSKPGEQTAWRKNVLLPMADMGDWHPLSDRLGEDIKDDILIEADWSYHRIYEDDSHGFDPPPETMPCTEDIVTDVWKNGTFGVVVWFTHGSATSARDVINIYRVNELNDNYKAFTFQASCNTAWPEENDNLAYELLQHGGICTIGATRSAWSLLGHYIKGKATIEGMAYEYTARVVPMGMPGGRALNALRQTIVPNYYDGALWMNYVDCNIYGDPSTAIYTPELRVDNITQDIRYPVIQWAIDEAENGDEIVLDPGTYTGIGNRDLDFLGKAVTIRSTDPGNPGVVASTVIDCSNKNRAFMLRDIEDGNPVISGLTITNGTGYVTWCRQSSPTITNCVFYNNPGRAVYLEFSDAVISHCAFTENGGGIYGAGGNLDIIDCTFIDNETDRGGAVYYSGNDETIIRDCTMVGNSASSDGGAFYGNSTGKLTIINCTISENRAENRGGGLYFWNEVSLVNTTVTGNTAGSHGGGMYVASGNPKVTNCTINGNRASDSGGGICCLGSNAEIVNSIFWENTADIGPEIALIYHFYYTTTLTVSYSDAKGGETGAYVENDCVLNWDDTNINSDPIFVASGYWDDNGTSGDPFDDIWNEGDYHLTEDSPCIDQGSNDAPDLPDTDFEGDLRIIDGDGNSTATVDMGADEYMPAVNACEGNFDDDGDVDGTDLAVFAADFGGTDFGAGDPCEGDFNGDGSDDLAVFAADFGRTDCPK